MTVMTMSLLFPVKGSSGVCMVFDTLCVGGRFGGETKPESWDWMPGKWLGRVFYRRIQADELMDEEGGNQTRHTRSSSQSHRVILICPEALNFCSEVIQGGAGCCI